LRGPKPEVGLLPVLLTAEAATDPVFAGIPREMLTFQWHGDTFSLPHGSVLLASSPAFPHQAFRWGKRAYGLQFHLEVSLDMAEDWLRVPAYARSLNEALGADSATTLMDQFGKSAERLRGDGRRLFARWLDLRD
jgi:GMP synthase-like glutamine amidotransferase